MNKSPEPARWWDLPAAAILLIALITASSRLVVTRWTDNLSIVQNLVVLGAIAGLALGQSKFSPTLAALFGFVYTIFVVPWQLGLTLSGSLPWAERLSLLAVRIVIVIKELSQKLPVTDSILFISLMALLYWSLSLAGGYMLTRHGNAWAAILPVGLTLLVINHWDSGSAQNRSRSFYLVIFLFTALVLVARTTFLQMYRHWQKTHTALPPQLGVDFISRSLVISTIILGLVWVTPTLADPLPVLEKATRPIQKAWEQFRENASNWVAPLRGSGAGGSDYYGTSLALGRGSLLTDDPVFQVILPKNIPEESRLYWRANVYDNYTSGRWANTAGNPLSYIANDSTLRFPMAFDRWSDTFQVNLSIKTSTLFGPGQLIMTNEPGLVNYAMNSDGTIDLFSFRAVPALKPGEAYLVKASISKTNQTSLRKATGSYPDWVKQRYLQLPESISARTHQLARDITAGLETPYDKVVAITNYLRDNIEYVNTIPDPPANREPIDWFLFDLKQGFCNYYATAEVILLRSIGIPARWAVGYAEGTLSSDKTFYQVLQRDAHAWPEVYFSGLGWIEFEPTASQPVIVRPASEATTPDDSASANPATRDLPQMEDNYLDQMRNRGDSGPLNLPDQGAARMWRTILIVGISLAVIFLLLLITRTANRSGFFLRAPIYLEAAIMRMGFRPPDRIYHLARRAELNPLARAYLEINYGLSRIKHHPAVTDTPTERAVNLGKLAPQTTAPAQLLVQEYQITTFSQNTGDLNIARQAGADIRKITMQTRLKQLAEPIQKIFNRKNS